MQEDELTRSVFEVNVSRRIKRETEVKMEESVKEGVEKHGIEWEATKTKNGKR